MATDENPSESITEEQALALADELRSADESHRREEYLKHFKILCCDDDESFLDFVKTVLKRYNMVTVERGGAVMNSCLQQNYSLILLDYHMPPPNGFSVLTTLKSNHHTKDIPVIIMTNETRRENINKLFMAGAEDCLIKPFAPEMLLQRIEGIFDRYVSGKNGRREITNEIVKRQIKNVPSIEKMSVDYKETERFIKSSFTFDDTIIHSLDELGTAFGNPENLTPGFVRMLEYSLHFSKMGGGAMFARQPGKKAFYLAASQNMSETLCLEILDKSSEEIFRLIATEHEPALFKDAAHQMCFVIYSFKLGKEMLAFLLLNIPGEKWRDLIARNRTLALFFSICRLELDNVQKQMALKESLLQLARAFSASLDACDPYTRGHSERVTMYALAINAMSEKYRPDYYIPRGELVLVGQLHDIGKIGLPDRLLLKPDKLTPDEYESVKKHVDIGRRMLKDVPSLKMAVDGLSHHERFDGSGYPDRLKGEQIPLVGRVLSVADAFDAMTTDRPYSKGLTKEAALEEIQRGSGHQFDPAVCELFINAYKEGLIGSVYEFEPSQPVPLVNIAMELEKAEKKMIEEDSSAAQKIISRLDEISFGSPHTHELLAKLNDPRGQISTLAKHIEMNAVISAKMLKAANSAFYGFPRRIRKVDQAIVLLGLKETRYIIQLHNMLSLYKDLKLSNFDLVKLSQHSLVVGLIARHLAKRFNKKNVCEDAFLAGLMHDIGKLPLIKLYPAKYEIVIDLVTQRKIAFSQAELETFGVDHSQLALHLCQKWNLPPFLGMCIINLHKENYVDTNPQSLMNIVKCADDLSFRGSKPCISNYAVIPLDSPCYRTIGIEPDNLQKELDKIEELLFENKEFLNIGES